MSKKRRKGQATVAKSVYATPFTWREPKQVMVINGVKIYGSSVYSYAEIADLSMVIDLSDTRLPERTLVTGNERAQQELSPSLFAHKVSIIYIGWNDGTAHTLTTGWWETLISEIEVLPEGSSVAVCCTGGTGRTGTALAVLAGLSDQLGPDELDPVAWIRTRYDTAAVETDEQIFYVAKVTGFPVLSDPSSFFFGSTSDPLGTQETDTQVALLSQEPVIGSLERSAFVGASDHTGS